MGTRGGGGGERERDQKRKGEESTERTHRVV
jgi:hypothetical protein